MIVYNWAINDYSASTTLTISIASFCYLKLRHKLIYVYQCKISKTINIREQKPYGIICNKQPYSVWEMLKIWME